MCIYLVIRVLTWKMECNKNYLNKIVISVFGGIAIVVVFLYASLSFDVQWEVNPNKYLHFPVNNLISKENASETPDQMLMDRFTNPPVKPADHLNDKGSFAIKLSDYLYNFPWKKLQASMKTANENLYRQKLIDGLQKYAFQEPSVPIDEKCKPPPLIDPKDIKCSNYPNAFLDEKYKTPVKVAHAIQLGFDADSLEIHLNEVYDVVDYFFILEATRVHCKTLRKMLMWSDLSVQPRFSKFRSKVINLVLDDVDVASVKWSNDAIWTLEAMQEERRWTKIKQWNKVTNALSGNDVIGFGDADEIASRENIHLLKYCPLKSRTLDIGIWFPFGRLDQAFASDWPVSRFGKNKYTLGDPTFYRWKDASAIVPPKYPSRKRGQSGNYLLGGIHLTYYTYLPYFMLKRLSATECGESEHIFSEDGINYLLEKHSLEILEKEFEKRVKYADRIKLLTHVEFDLSQIVVLPWFYKCNSQRYPAWKGEHDTRVT